MNEPAYQRLAQSALSSLWLGPDHILLVNSSFFEENYKRFYFRDIQAITLRKNSVRKIWNLSLVVPIGICVFGLVISATPAANSTAIAVWSIIAGLLAIPFVINNLLGAGCNCYLRTAVQNNSLPALGRLPRARRALDHLRPLIVAAQGQLAPEEVSSRMREAARGETAASHPEPPPAPEPPVLS